MKIGWIRTVSGAVFAGLLAVGVMTTASTDTYSAQRHSCGYHCTPDGSGATPAAPPETPEIQLARVNVHSGGRTGGAANKRVGCGGCKGHPASVGIGAAAGIQPLMTDGFNRNRGTRPKHPRATCRCN